METTRSGGTGVGAVLGVLGLVAAVSVGAIALSSNTPAGASGLERFASCAELETWTEDTAGVVGNAGFADEGGAGDGAAGGRAGVDTEDSDATVSAEAPTAAPPEPTSSGAGQAGGDAGGEAGASYDTEESAGLASTDDAGTGDGGAGGDTGGTNTVVEGVDEIDIIDRVGDDRLLVSRNGTLALVDLTGRTIVAEERSVPWDARISVAGDLIWVAGSAEDGMSTEVRRIRIEGDAFVEDGRWSTPGYLQDARRTGDRLHLIAVDHGYDQTIPFEGGPVPCDQVWRPTDPAITPAATLVVTLPATGALEPTAAAQITGSGGNLLVTNESVYVATESWDAEGIPTSGIHRFDLADLTPTGSGSVPGSVAGPFAMNEHEGLLRVATNAGNGFMGMPMPIEGDVLVDDVAVDPAISRVPSQTAEGPGPLAEVFVLDTEGDLDILGQTGRFGHDGETIHGVRFVGDVAYVVTFLQTDPFWVVDLSDPAAPQTVGELEIPGFSGYLHPVSDDRVVGFGPDGNGATAARLFDVSDPADPSVIDEIALGDDSTAAYDHHAFVSLDESRFAVPFADYPEYREVTVCDNPIPIDPGPRPLPEPLPDVLPTEPDAGIGSSGSSGTTGSAGATTPSAPATAVETVPSFYCEPEVIGGETGAVVLEVVDGRLSVADRASVTDTDAYAERIVALPDGAWFLLSWDRLVATDDGGEIVLPVR